MGAPPSYGETRSETPFSIPTARECPRCGSPAASFQEYCLECGLRLPEDVGGDGGPLRRPRTAGEWVWPVLVTFVVAALAGVTVVVLGLPGGNDRPFLIATSPVTVTMPTTAPPPQTAPTVTQPTTVPTQPPTTTSTQPPPPPQGRLITWPPGRTAWTLVLASIDATSGRPVATMNAREAVDAGLSDVGVLRTDSFSSLRPGYYVVFSGFYETQGEAEQAIATARERGFETAYARQVIP